MTQPGLFARWFHRFERLVALWMLFGWYKRIQRDGLGKFLKAAAGFVLSRAKALPGVQGALNAELDKEVAKIELKMHGAGDPTAVVSLPATGRSADAVLALATERTAEEDKSGKSWGGVYHETRGPPGELSKLQAEMWARFNQTNALYPTIFTSVRKFEAEIISCCVGLVHGHEAKATLCALTDGSQGSGGVSAKGLMLNGTSSSSSSSSSSSNGKHELALPLKAWNCEGPAVGLLTSGGTESILIAIFAYRQLAYDRGIGAPEIVGCYTAHPALDKACHYFGLKLVKVQAEQATQQLRASAVAAAMTPNTIAIYASAPTFPHGVVDPIPELAGLARARDVGLHVDNCLGGFYLSFLQKAGVFPHAFDFQVPGVTTMSVDVHKYGFASKGASVVAFRNNALRRSTYFPITDGPTLYVTPTLQGARSGATMAAAWATLLHMGESGYVAAFEKLNGIFEAVRAAVRATDGVRLLVDSQLAIVPICSEDPAINIYTVASEMSKRGWNMFTSAAPPAMAFCVGEQHHDLIDGWQADLAASVAHCKANPGLKPEGDAAIYGTAEVLPEEILDSVVRSYLDVKLSVRPLNAANIAQANAAAPQ